MWTITIYYKILYRIYWLSNEKLSTRNLTLLMGKNIETLLMGKNGFK